MKITNKLNLPKAFVNFYSNDEKEHTFDEHRFSVTELLGSVQQIMLCRKYREQINRDIADMIPALFGTAVHSVLEKNASDDVKTEVKLEAKIDSYTIVGRCDVLNENEKLIEDYKTCSVSKISKEDFEDWRLQGLMYAWMCYYFYGIEIRHLKFYALMKDWSKLKSNYGSNYPASPIYVWSYDIEDSDFDYINRWLKTKLEQLQNYENYQCSEEDKWYTGTKYAVYKNENDSRASYVADTEEDANNYVANKGGIVKVRYGDNLKCLYYCDCKEFCEQYKKESK